MKGKVMKASTMLRPARMQRRLEPLRRGPFKRSRPQPTGLARLTSLLARVTAALRRLVARLAGRSKVTASDGGGRAAPRAPSAVPAALAAVSTIWSHRERFASMTHHRSGDGDRTARQPGAARVAPTTHRAPRRSRARVVDTVNRLATRGR
jgi:hypothetical protein